MNELKKLNRKELLEILLASKEENEKLKKENEELKKQLEERAIILKRAGSIADAALELNGVFKAAQEAAEQYVESVRATVEAKTGIGADDRRSDTSQ